MTRGAIVSFAVALATNAAGQQKAPVFAPADLGGSYVMEFEHGPIHYARPSRLDPVARLARRIESGEVKLEFAPKHGYLPSLLANLGVPVSSQVLVFSKTSFQLHKIGPETPRAVYFGDDVYAGFVQRGDVLELSAVDPERGAIFYTLEQRPTGKPVFRRQDDCLQCHASGRTVGVPGHLVRSVPVDSEGQPMFTGGGYITDHRSPFEERWGGWYVTGTHGAQRHMGNVVVKDRAQPDKLDREAGANVTSLARIGVDVSPYLAPDSDIVALMVLEHQTRMHNLITRVAFETRLAVESQSAMDKALGKDEAGPEQWSDSTKRRIFGPAETLLRYMLFIEEPKLTAAVQGTSAFQRDFPKAGRRDRRGRSLRDLDLNQRLFRYPMSFLVYSEAFDALPEPARGYIYRRLKQVLTGEDARPEFSRALTAQDRTALREILIDTKREFAELFAPSERTSVRREGANQ